MLGGGGTYYSNVCSLIVQQNLLMRVIFKKKALESARPLYFLFKVLPLRYLYVYKVMTIFYKISGNLPSNDASYRCKLRHSHNVEIPRAFLTFYQKTYEFLAPRIFNLLPNELKTLCSISKFRKQIKAWLFSLNCVEHLVNV